MMSFMTDVRKFNFEIRVVVGSSWWIWVEVIGTSLLNLVSPFQIRVTELPDVDGSSLLGVCGGGCMIDRVSALSKRSLVWRSYLVACSVVGVFHCRAARTTEIFGGKSKVKIVHLFVTEQSRTKPQRTKVSTLLSSGIYQCWDWRFVLSRINKQITRRENIAEFSSHHALSSLSNNIITKKTSACHGKR